MWETRPTRRGFVVTTLLALAGCTRRRAATPLRAEWPLYVGTYTDGGRSRGIYRIALDRTTGALRNEGLAAETVNPSYLALAPDGRTLYAVNEVTTFEGQPSGAVTAFARDGASGALARAAQRASQGGAPCYVTVDRRGRHVLVANYVGGNVAVLPAEAGGGLAAASVVRQHHGRGPNRERQEAPHAHCVVLDAANRFALAADLGIDRVLVYRFDERTGALEPATEPEVALRGVAWQNSTVPRSGVWTRTVAGQPATRDAESAGSWRALQRMASRKGSGTSIGSSPARLARTTRSPLPRMNCVGMSRSRSSASVSRGMGPGTTSPPTTRRSTPSRRSSASTASSAGRLP
jgi:hypothetical protein